MLILAFGFLALAAALEFRSRGDLLLRHPGSDRAWRAIGTVCGLLAGFGPVVVMARIGLAQGAGAYLLGAAFAFLGGFTPVRLWPLISPAAGIFGIGLLLGAVLR